MKKKKRKIIELTLVFLSAAILFTGSTLYGPPSRTASGGQTDSPKPDVSPGAGTAAAASPVPITPAPSPSASLTAQDVIDRARRDPSVPAALTDRLQEALDRNPEIRPFIKYFFSANPTVKGGIKESEKKQEYPLFIQWDRRWGYVPYGDDDIGLSGCAPACLSMVIYSLTRDETATPDAIAAYAMEKGYYVYGTGTEWGLLTDIPQPYPVEASQLSPGEAQMKASLDQGHLLICSMGPGVFTDNGHFIMVYGYDEDGFSVNDPFSHENSEKKWLYREFGSQVKGIWEYWTA